MLGLVDLTAVIGRFRAAHPGVSVHLRVAGSAALADRLREGEIDLALLAMLGPPPAELRLRPVGSTDFVVLVPTDHPLAARCEVDLADVVTSAAIDSPVGFGDRDLVDAEVARRGLDREVVVEAPDAWSIPELVRLGVGLAVVPRFVAARAGPGLRSLALAGDPMRWSLYLASARWSRPARAAAHLLTMLLDGSAESPSSPREPSDATAIG